MCMCVCMSHIWTSRQHVISHVWTIHGTHITLHCTHINTTRHTYVCVYVCHTYERVASHICTSHVTPMGWLRSVGSIKLQVSFPEYRLFYRALLQKRPIISPILLTKAIPYEQGMSPIWSCHITHMNDPQHTHCVTRTNSAYRWLEHCCW